MKIVTVIGARPQFIKSSVVSQAIASEVGLNEVVINTGQHFDANMSDVFFRQLDLPRPQHQLGISGGGHGEMTGRMLVEIERVLADEKPGRVIVYGDTNSTLAGALAAVKLHIPVAHIESGLRSFNMRMPEEVNRILTDRISDVLYCPTEIAMQNLRDEGFERKSTELLLVGDVMQDSAHFYAQHSTPPDDVPALDNFILATLHRAENTDNRLRLASILDALNELHAETATVVLPLHPRTRAAIKEYELNVDVCVIDPVGYLQMLWLLQKCSLVLTDSGGVQKESFFFGKHCVTLRDETEWLELVSAGVNRLVGADSSAIVNAANASIGCPIRTDLDLYGGGNAVKKIVEHLLSLAGAG